jgi:hypothetical protein
MASFFKTGPPRLLAKKGPVAKKEVSLDRSWRLFFALPVVRFLLAFAVARLSVHSGGSVFVAHRRSYMILPQLPKRAD